MFGFGNKKFEKLKNNLRGMNFVEAINFLNLDTPQFEPNYKVIKRLKKKFPEASDFEDYVTKILDKNPEAERPSKLIADSLKISEKDLMDYQGHNSFHNVVNYGAFNYVSLAMLAANDDILVDEVFKSLEEIGDTAWLTYIILISFPSNESVFKTRVPAEREFCVFDAFFEKVKTEEKLKQFFKLFIDNNPNYSFYLERMS